MDIRRIGQNIASRVSNTGILARIENFFIDKLIEEPISKEDREKQEEVFGKEGEGKREEGKF